MGQYDAAFDAYHRAAALSPTAQSPWLALSHLARRRGDRAAALRALQQVFDLPSEPDRDDPWWRLHESLESTMFQVHPYHNPVIGWFEEVTKVPRGSPLWRCS